MYSRRLIYLLIMILNTLLRLIAVLEPEVKIVSELFQDIHVATRILISASCSSDRIVIMSVTAGLLLASKLIVIHLAFVASTYWTFG